MARLEPVRGPDGSLHYRSPALAALGVPHLFTTRVGEGGRPWDVGPLDDATGRALARRAGSGATEVRDAVQVHGPEVVDADRLGEERPHADGLVTTDPGRLVLVRTADCVPVLLATRDGVRVAAVHAGWRGIVAGVLARAVEVLGEPPEAAALGPSVSVERFEVGPEVERAFAEVGLASVVRAAHVDRTVEKAHIDLRAAVALQLEALGVQRVDTSDRCTYLDANELWSFRRDVTHGGAERTGRLAALVGPREAGRGAPP